MTDNFKRLGIYILLILGLVLFIVTNRTPEVQSNPIKVNSNELSESRVNQAKSKPKAIRTFLVAKGLKVSTAKQELRNERIIYLSNQKSGVVGRIGKQQSDTPADNIFTLQVDSMPTDKDKVWLTYKLNGLQENANVSCSVNDRYAFGGYLVKANAKSNLQRVQLNPEWLHSGENRIQFSLPENSLYGYEISELTLEVEHGAGELLLTVNQSSSLYNGKAYIHGFVKDASKSKAQVLLNGKQVTLNDGEFEAIVDASANRKVDVTAYANGVSVTKKLLFDQNVQADTVFALNTHFEKSKKTFVKGKAENLKTSNALLSVDDRALISTKELSLSSLRDVDLPALDMGIVNTTEGDRGFRFLPHGNHFSEGATVALKYDRTKIPDGYTEDDIKTFYFDTTTKHWLPLERDSLDKTLCMVVSKTTHFTDMINGVIKTPESPESEAFVPTMMSDVKIGDPSSGIQLIAPPTANSSGSANLTYSLELVPMLQRIAPNLDVQYNSDGGSGWLGEGWDLNTPSIKVDSRWGVPRYDPLYETETYLLNGTMLTTVVKDKTGKTAIPGSDLGDSLGIVSVSHRGTMYTRLYDNRADIQGYEFHQQVEGNFSQIIRKNSSPQSYYWIVSDKNGTKYIYGDSAQNVLQGKNVKTFFFNGDTKIQNTVDPIVEWKLSKIVGIHGESCIFKYDTLGSVINSGVRSKQIHLKQIQLFNSDGICCQTINFQTSKLKVKNQISARYGFITSDNKLLEGVDINALYPDNKMHRVRSYQFKYSSNDSITDLLDSIVQFDTAGIKISRHAFTYKKIDPSNLYQSAENWTVENRVNNLTALGGGNSSSDGLSFYTGLGVAASDIVAAEALYNHSSSNTKTAKKMMIVDINGDGLPDNIYLKEDG